MISLRLPQDLERELENISKISGKTKTDIVKESLNQYFKNSSIKTSPYELGKDLFGVAESGDVNISRDRKRIVMEKISNKHDKRINS